MKADIHPEYNVLTVTCSCGNKFETRSTTGEIRVEICSNCHPFYTGKQKIIDAAGRVERFNQKYGISKSEEEAGEAAEASAEVAVAVEDESTEK